MPDSRPRVSLIGRGTTGTDGIPAGNHLRWFFDRRLGFPLGGFRLYRRLAARTEWRLRQCTYKERSEFEKKDHRTADFPCPYVIPALVTFKSDVPFWGAPQDPSSKKTKSIHFTEYLDIVLPMRVHQAEVDCFRKSGPFLGIEAIDSQTGQVVDSQISTPNPDRLERVQLKVSGESFDTLRLKAQTGGFHSVTFDWYAPEKLGHGEWSLISGKDPISLPYTHAHYPLKHRYSGQPDGDWLEAQRRRGKRNPFKRQDFDEMLEVFAGMFGVPEESLLIRYFDYAAEGGRPQDQGLSLHVLPSDLLLLTSLDPTVARILGLAFPDRKAEEGLPYDYRIEGTWTKGNHWLLEDHVTTFDQAALGHLYLPYFAVEDLVFEGQNQHIVGQSSDLAGTTQALAPAGSPTNRLKITFPQRVREIQVFVSGDLTGAKLTGYRDEVRRQTIGADSTSQEQILHLSNPKGFDQVELEGRVIYVHKICYALEHLGHPESKEVIHTDFRNGLMVQDAEAPAPPTGLAATTFTGMTLPAENGIRLRDARLGVGLSWDVGGTQEGLVRFLVYREDPDGQRKVLNENAPVIGNMGPLDLEAETEESHDHSFLKDWLPGPGRYLYSVRGMDLFGRTSGYSPPITVEPAEALYLPPPPPVDVGARILDGADANLSSDDQRQLAEAGAATALLVTWAWGTGQAEQNPDVSRFHVHVQPGWLNTHTVQILEAEDNGDGTATTLVESRVLRGVPARDLAGCTLQSAGQFYPVQRSAAATGNGRVSLTIGQPEGVANAATALETASAIDLGAQALLATRQARFVYLPQKGDGSLAILPASPLYTDYGHSAKWMHWRLASVAKSNDSDFQAVIPSPIAASGRDPLVYAQVTVTADDDRQESATAPAATVYVVHRVPPPTPQRSTSADLYATFPDVHGRSTYTFAFPQYAPYYEVYRASLATLLSVDRVQRQSGRSRSEADYAGFLASYPAEPLRSDIVEQVIEPGANAIAYDDLDNDLLQALASLPGNEEAFGRLHSGKLASADHANPANLSEFAYTDKTLPGMGAGRYFYRARAVDSAENASPLGPATLPITLRDVNPPRTPDIVSLLGSDRQIRVRWNANRESHLAEYRLYRTSDPDSAQDIRLMDQAMVCGQEDYVTEESHQREYVDAGRVPRVPHFYRLVAVRRLSYEDGQEAVVPSQPSPALQAQAYDGAIPEPPSWLPVQALAEGIELLWESKDAGLSCLVQRKAAGSPEWVSLSGWLDPGGYRFLDTSRPPGEPAEYRLKVMDTAGRLNRDYDILEVGP